MARDEHLDPHPFSTTPAVPESIEDHLQPPTAPAFPAAEVAATPIVDSPPLALSLDSNPTDTFHHSVIVDPALLRELQALVADAVARQDGTELREFHTSRRAVYGRLRDAESIRFDPLAFLLAQAWIDRIAKNHDFDTPEGRAFLGTLWRTSTRPRDVSKAAFEMFLKCGPQLERFGPHVSGTPIMANTIQRALRALRALDSFDLSVRTDRDLPPDPIPDEQLVNECLAVIRVPRTYDIGMGYGGSIHFRKAPEAFARPTAPSALVGWERFCGVPPCHAPRAATREHFPAVMSKAKELLGRVAQDCELEPEDRKFAVDYLRRYRRGLRFAASRWYTVVEWVLPADV